MVAGWLLEGQRMAEARLRDGKEGIGGSSGDRLGMAGTYWQLIGGRCGGDHGTFVAHLG